MYDVWDVIGLNGTGTDSYSVENLFIPEKFAALRDDPAALRETGPALRHHHLHDVRHGLCRDLARRRPRHAGCGHRSGARQASHGLKAMRENNAVQGLIGRTEAKLRAARAYLYATAAEVWRDLAHGDASPKQHRIALRLAATWTIHQAAAVVDTAYHMAGATAVFSANTFERRFRDMHAIAQQIQARDTHYEDVGKAILSATCSAPRRRRDVGTAARCCHVVQRPGYHGNAPSVVKHFLGISELILSRSFGIPMFKLRSIAARLILAISLTVAAACAILGTFSIMQQRSLTRLALDQQLKLQYDSVIAAIDYEGRAALAVSSVIAALPPVGDAIAKGDRDGAGARCLAAPMKALKAQGIPLITFQTPPATHLLSRSRSEDLRRRHLGAPQHRGGSDQDRQADRRRRTRAGVARHFRA